MLIAPNRIKMTYLFYCIFLCLSS